MFKKPYMSHNFHDCDKGLLTRVYDKIQNFID